jgi:hypothetical protein
MHGKLADISMENFAFSQRIIKLHVREVLQKKITPFRDRLMQQTLLGFATSINKQIVILIFTIWSYS